MNKEQLNEKFKGFKEKAKETCFGILTLIEEHPVASAMLISVSVKVVSKAIKCAGIYNDNVHRNRDFYDPRRGMYVRTRRTPTTRELLEIDRRYKNGESYVSILADLGLTRR